MAQFNEYTANGNTTFFAYRFPAFDQNDIEVRLNNVVQTSGWNALGLGGGNGGAIEFATAPANGVVVRISRVRIPPQVSYLVRDENLADLTDVVEARTNLGLVPGVDVQAFDADLDWLSTNLTIAGKAILDDADATAQRATLGAAAASHTHPDSDITGLTEAVQDVVGSLFVAAGGSYDDAAGTVAFPPTGLVTADTTLTVGSGQEFETVTAALASLADKRIKPGATVTISVIAGVIAEPGTIAVHHPDGIRIVITGATDTVSTTITGLYANDSLTLGAMQPVISVASTSGFAAGDWVAITATGASSASMGHHCLRGFWQIASIPASGRIKLNTSICANGSKWNDLNAGTVTKVATVLTFSGSANGFEVKPGCHLDLRRIGLVGATGIAVSAAMPGAGTVQLSQVKVGNWSNAIVLGNTGFAAESLIVSGRYNAACNGLTLDGGRTNALQSTLTGFNGTGVTVTNGRHVMSNSVVAGCAGQGIQVMEGGVVDWNGSSARVIYCGYNAGAASCSAQTNAMLTLAEARGECEIAYFAHASLGGFIDMYAVKNRDGSYASTGATSADMYAVSHGRIRNTYYGTMVCDPAINTTGNGNGHITTY